MKYQDFCSPSDHEYTLMKQNYEKMQAQETEDLHELLVKMNNQLDALKSNNSDGKYSPIIDKLASSIADLEKLINANHSQFLHKIKKMGDRTNLPHNPPKKLSPDDFCHTLQDTYNDSSENPLYNNSPKATDDISSSPQINTPSENLQNGDTSNSANNSPNGENNIVDNRQNDDTNNISNNLESSNSNSTPENNNYIDNIENSEDNNADTLPKSSKRNSPTQGNRLYNALKSLNENLNNNLNRIFGMPQPPHRPPQPYPQSQYSPNSTNTFPHSPNSPNTSPHSPNLPNTSTHSSPNLPNTSPFNPNSPNIPPHTPNPPTIPPHDINDECEFSKICKNNQIDIIRLFLLYMMLRPTCKYLPTITTIANDQFDILLELL